MAASHELEDIIDENGRITVDLSVHISLETKRTWTWLSTLGQVRNIIIVVARWNDFEGLGSDTTAYYMHICNRNTEISSLLAVTILL